MPSKPINRLLSHSNINGRDVAVFLLSLLLAFSIWLIHNLSLQYSQVMSVPVNAESNIDGHSAHSANSCVIVARCRTTGFNLVKSRFDSRRRVKSVYFSPDDLHQVSGEVYSITANELGGYVNDIFGDDIQLESIVSSNVEFRFPYENHKKVPVVLNSTISYRPQYMAVGGIVTIPDSVTVYGEPLRLSNIDKVVTSNVTLEDLSSSAHGVASLEAPSGLRLSHSEVSYTLEVSRYVEVEAEVEISVRNVPAGKELSVFPSVATAVFRCAFPLSVDPSDYAQFYIDYYDFARSINGRCVPHAASIPSGVLDYSLEPQVFECIENLRK